MRVDLIAIGNSRGIRIPKPLIEQCGFGETVDMRVEHDRLIIAPDRPPRHGWEQAFQAAGASVEDEILLDDMSESDFDREEWEW